MALIMLPGIYFIKHYFFRFIHEICLINGPASVCPCYSRDCLQKVCVCLYTYIAINGDAYPMRQHLYVLVCG